MPVADAVPEAQGVDPTTAPPGGDPGAVPSGQAAAGPEGSGVLPPTGGAGAVDASIPQQGNEAMGREGGRKVVGALHMLRTLFSPFSEEGKAIDKAIRNLIPHFRPDKESGQDGKVPDLAQMAGPQGQGGPPQMAPQGGAPPPGGPPMGPGAMPQPPSGPIPRLAGATA